MRIRDDESSAEKNLSDCPAAMLVNVQFGRVLDSWNILLDSEGQPLLHLEKPTQTDNRSGRDVIIII